MGRTQAEIDAWLRSLNEDAIHDDPKVANIAPRDEPFTLDVDCHLNISMQAEIEKMTNFQNSSNAF